MNSNWSETSARTVRCRATTGKELPDATLGYRGEADKNILKWKMEKDWGWIWLKEDKKEKRA